MLDISLFIRLARRFARDEDGNVLVYVSVSAAVLLGMVGLALDSSRAMITHSEAQAAADAAALAGASQIDGQSGACARAKAEAALVANRQRFAQGGPSDVTIAAGSPVCLNGLPSSDSASLAGFVTTDDAATRYIQVTTQQLTHQNALLDAVTSNRTATIQRAAVAGFRRSLCAPAPVMMVCDTMSWTPGVAIDVWVNSADNKGFISNCGPSAPCVQTTLASLQPSFCVSDSSLLPQPGNKTEKAQDGIDTRFGIGSTTTAPADLDIVSYPHDNVAGSLGWNCAGYFSANHASDGLAPPAGCTASATTVTRYSVYQLERSTGKIPAAGQPAPGTPTTTTERRLIYLAIFNCSGGTIAEGFIKAFMIEPATGKSTKTQYVEPLGLATSRTDPTAIHEEVQLYR